MLLYKSLFGEIENTGPDDPLCIVEKLVRSAKGEYITDLAIVPIPVFLLIHLAFGLFDPFLVFGFSVGALAILKKQNQSYRLVFERNLQALRLSHYKMTMRLSDSEADSFREFVLELISSIPPFRRKMIQDIL